jgi:hypothetical protein
MIGWETAVFLNTVSPDGETDWFLSETGYRVVLTLSDDTTVSTGSFTTEKTTVNYPDSSYAVRLVQRTFTVSGLSKPAEIAKIALETVTDVLIAEYWFDGSEQAEGPFIMVESNEGLKIQHTMMREYRSETVVLASDDNAVVKLGPQEQGGLSPFTENFVKRNTALVHVDDNSAPVVAAVDATVTVTQVPEANALDYSIVIHLIPESGYSAGFTLSQVYRLALGTDDITLPGSVIWEFDQPRQRDETTVLELSCTFRETIKVYG